MKRKLLLILAALLPLMASADAVEIDGIFYNLQSKNKSAEVTHPHKYHKVHSGALNIPASVTYEGVEYSVTSIGELAFHLDSLTTVTIPNSVTEIGESAFEGCRSLISVTIPNSVTEIGEEAFKNCRSLTSVTLPNSVTEIGKEAFMSCESLTSITIPSTNEVFDIGEGAFMFCESLTSVTFLSNKVNSIWSDAFRGCKNLTSVTIDGCAIIRGDAFRDCTKLKEIYCCPPEGNISVLEDAFDGVKESKIKLFVPEDLIMEYEEFKDNPVYKKFKIKKATGTPKKGK